MASRDTMASMEELLHRDHYRPEELAALLGIDSGVVRHAAFVGDLKAFIVDHHIVDIQRADALAWLRERDIPIRQRPRT